MSAAIQHTLAGPATLEGTSLHTGQKVTLTIKPALEGHGFKFRRIDLPDQPFINADVEKVQTVERATTLSEGSVKVHTVEHIISALTGMGVDNALIEMDANEPPIGDGSSRPFVEMIKQVGIVAQTMPRRIWEIREPIHQETDDGTIITIVPCKTFKVSVTNVGPDGRFTQYFSTDVTPETYEKEICAARTFVYYEDVKPLLDKGLIKGGSLESAVVIRGNEILSKEPMRFTNEFARHKALDIIGDLMLSGVRIRGHVIAVKPGHGPNTKMAATLKLEYQRMRSMVPTPVNLPEGEGVLDINEVLRILPHRYPFLMVDRIVDSLSVNKCVAVKNVTINEPYFIGHFPGHPIMPGVLQLEAMAQVSSVLMLRKPENTGKLGLFMSANNVKWRRPVLPGDTLFIETEIVKIRGSIGQTRCRCLVNGEIVSEAELKFALLDR
ncbi:MAG: bifunctional UDP-3-O-[3-hydroxymyristoyl] N-acetylglucosamine deacetylase/3-hydroxyacyl-ACP dehydratase [Gloeobacteraceae cyanobacterium ES-bin-144]|nr:bifunctional UDP-3-O-[3-hydroxymyristoyl] N-acetylglucosamine deacetylase/3-hydroxyacyl-ACP dehydratase [Verrucomicrobiales bacterium]